MVTPNNQSLTELTENEKGTEMFGPEKPEKDHLEWTADLEVSLFYAMVGHKPVGPNRFFQMYFVHQNFCSLICKDIDVSVIWKKLETMYDLATLDESESVTTKGEIFSLPVSTFGKLMENAKLEGKESIIKNKDNFSTKSKDDKYAHTNPDEVLIKKEETDLKSNALSKNDNSAKSAVVPKLISAKRDSKDTKKANVKEKEKKDAKKDIQDMVKGGDAKDSVTKRDNKEPVTDDDREIIKKNEKIKKDLKENKKFKKESIDKKFTDQFKKDTEGKKTESLKKIDSKSETTKPTRVETLKREAYFDKKKDTDKKEIKADKKLEKNVDKKSDFNKSIDKKGDLAKNSDKKMDGKSFFERKSEKSFEKKSELNKSDKRIESGKKLDKKAEKIVNNKVIDTGGSSSVKSPDLSGKPRSKTPDTGKKLKEKKDSEGDKSEKEAFSLKRLRDSWSSDETPVKRPKGRPTRNSVEAVIKPVTTPNAIIPGKRRRVL